MSSIEDGKLRELGSAFFDDVLMPMAGRMRASGATPFLLRPDAARATYYVPRARRSMTHDDFTAPSCLDFEEFEQRLAAHWSALGRDALAAEAGRVADLARAAHATFAPDEQDGEVSPYIYVMF